MLVVVKMRRTNNKLFDVQGDIPRKVINYLKKEFGERLSIVPSKEENDNIDPFKTAWYKRIKSKTTIGDAVKIYRENLQFSQDQLAREINKRLNTKFTRQKISDVENDRRKPGKDVARTLSEIFNTSVDRFI